MRQKIPRGPMPPQLQVTRKQETVLQRIIRRATSPQSLALRTKIVLASTAYGRRNTQIGRDLNCNPQTVATWRNRWTAGWARLTEIEGGGDERALERAIIEVLSDLPRPGTPAKFSSEQVCQIISVACETPALSGRPITEWTPRELADEVVRRKIVDSISPTQVGRFLKRGSVETASEPVLAE